MHISEKYFLFAVMLIFCSCGKSAYVNPGLPNPTQTGANTFGAYLNGKLWVAQPCVMCINGGTGINSFYSLSTKSFNLTGQSTNHNIQAGYVIINIENLDGPGEYTLAGKNLDGSGTFGEISLEGTNIASNEYLTGQTNQGTVTITRLDTVKHIISGTVEMQALLNEPQATAIVKATSGRFDVTY